MDANGEELFKFDSTVVGGAIPVSYTHLDVYKRQEQTIRFSTRTIKMQVLVR